MNTLYWIWAAFAACTGLVLGSFWNVAIARWPVDQSVVAPRSHCPYCGTTLTARDLVPVLSWVALGGKCRTCKSPIAPTYPIIEALGGCLAFLLYRRVVPDPTALDPAHLTAWALYFLFLTLLVIAAYVDLRHWIIPDETSIYAVPAGFLSVLVLGWLGYDGWMAIGWRESITGALTGGGIMASASIAFRAFLGQEALGWGDVKLMAMIGAFIGPLAVLFLVLLPGSLIGAVAGLTHMFAVGRRTYLPFGPSLVLAAVLYVFYGDAIARWLVPGIAMFMGIT